METLFISSQSRQSDFDVLIMYVFFPICNLNWRVNNYFSRFGKCINKRNESRKRGEVMLIFWSTDDIIQYCQFPSLYCWKLLKA